MPHVDTQGHLRKWWKEGIAYQIYPASYKDSNNDGVGDLNGIISKLDYIKDLGIDIIWLSPHFASPQVDMGYDISNYEDVHRPYGTIGDCERLIEEVHDRGMRIIFDLVINHTSDQHAWFKESRSSKDNPKRDWYIWRPAKYDEFGNRCRPNNWQGNFTVPAWTWDEGSQEYYLHLFASEQPDLNWENEECRKAVYKSAITFWLDKGVDGFRIDTVNLYSKVYEYNTETGIMDLPDAPISNPGEDCQFGPMLWCNGPRMKEWLTEMNNIFDKYNVMTVGELPHTPEVSDVMNYISAKERQLQMVFNFDAVNLGQTKGARFKTVPFGPADFKKELSRWQSIMNGTDAWTTVFTENHDQGRSISRFASDAPEHRTQAGKMLALIQATMTGTLFLYQGQEIGMINVPRSWGFEEYKCIKSVNYHNAIKKQSNTESVLSEALNGMQLVARDHARVPMQWDSSPHAGFCGPNAKPWMRVVDSFAEINVADQIGRKDSLLEFWKRTLFLRKEHKDLFVYGDFKTVEQGDKLMVFTKTSREKTCLTVANLTDEAQKWQVPEEVSGLTLKLLINNKGSSEDELLPYEGRVYISR